MDRITMRVPRKMLERAEQLVEQGNYDNRSEVFREGARELFARYNFDGVQRTPAGVGDTPIIQVTPTNDKHAMASRVHTLRAASNGRPFIVFDAGGNLDADILPDDVTVTRTPRGFKRAIQEAGR